jgi:hypothetical protein
LAFTNLVNAESADCTAPVIIVPDGRLTQGSFPAGTTYWYGIYTQAGHSYFVEFVPPADNAVGAIRPLFSYLSVYAPTDSLQSCRGVSSAVITQNSGYAPAILKSGNGAGRRVSFIAQSSGLYLVAATNIGGTGGYTFRAGDTTLFNPRWGTNGGNDVQWGFLNVSDMPVTGTLTLFDINGQVLTTIAIGIPPGGRSGRYSGSSDLNLPRNLAGSAMFSHNGPPNSIIADAFIVSSAGLAPMPVKFESSGH